MKKIAIILSCLITFLIFNEVSFSQTDSSMQKWIDYMTPGDMHEYLAKAVGKWNVNATFWMAPDTEPIVNNYTANGEMIFGGRYLMLKQEGNMMGMPFEGMLIEGYDNATKMFNAVWIDNMGTGIAYSTGTINDELNQVTFTGSMIDPMTGEPSNFRQTEKFNNDGSVTVEFYSKIDGVEFLNSRIILTR
ncbi:MAG: DUF1579 domain-containing protein [Ignavibacteria bacterium]|jgi:hypothetical protein|nr:MAG: DUF1579 domain-containing protein [Chlorobiota bacterium]KXK03682.1 MAG: hypothetical protein UZ04_CHB001001322 [Chlorobi bacterium OLB4]MBV6398924.1 hypothetical protein [Ignavibacteria bacterium]MCC6886237.1 DUF1579 domain-containing protein [Ignavibacteriales bacterium]MCE7952309.1 DUF1579 domain-containing protein [Chlorobi bacterium CHB7]OQY77056.1 MAG: hypothetical protein B6D43_08065 [Ignavibacteriales bacterium UTCHB1]RIK48566.1 MAG: hypothetical protein DCC60_07120 [Ignavibac